MSNSIQHIFHFIGLLMVQVLVIDQISFGALNPYINPIVLGTSILILPVSWRGPRLLLVGFLFGIILDAFHNTLGINASAMLIIAFLRPYILRLISPREGFESFFSPNVTSLPSGQYILYSSLLLLSFHLTYFAFESLNYQATLSVFIKALASTVAAIILSALYQYLTIKKQ
ncbi:MAG: hypothetical protein N4A35_01615 [Flavobacteriales bacterium]|jgi:rod shape-determining protein MreD|nr:hypothetical protein [Flavobacteriales bacterium]